MALWQGAPVEAGMTIFHSFIYCQKPTIIRFTNSDIYIKVEQAATIYGVICFRDHKELFMYIDVLNCIKIDEKYENVVKCSKMKLRLVFSL